MKKTLLKSFLDEKVAEYNQPKFMESDPISIPHQFTTKEDIEISAFLIATIAWGKRKMIIKNGLRILELMDHSPYDFILNHQESDLGRLDGFVHRTFNSFDFKFFVSSLQNIYINHHGLESAFSLGIKKNHTNCSFAIDQFRSIFFEKINETKFRTFKHVSSPLKGSAAKRTNMFLRWMVRQDNNGVDFGIWRSITPSILSCPLDVHSGNVARKLGLLHRKQNDWKAVQELDASLRKLDPNDPVKYDFALFGLGVFENF